MTRRSKIAAAVVLAAVATEAAVALPVTFWSGQVVDWIRNAGGAGMAVFALVYIAATLLLVPGLALTAAAGLAYGPVVGTLLVSPVSVIAATLAFLVGRTVGRQWMTRRVEANPTFAAIDTAIGRSGLRLVTLLRLSPVLPFSVLNYALGLTQISMRDYVLGSFVGMLPGTVLYVYLGAAVSSAGALSHTGGVARQILYWVGLAASVIVVVVVSRVARRALTKELGVTSSVVLS
jgi:uncharacterized membrane protein YdjX (TVP38/TMEM64 family)